MEFPIQWLDETPSTNRYVKESFLRGEWTAPVAVAARRQTEGRGRLGRLWESAPDEALALSVLVPRTLASGVTLAAGVAVTRALWRECGVKTALKWPNDSICAERKIGGILCEGIVGEKSATVIGIGVNVSQSAAFFDEKGLPYGGSLFSTAGVTTTPQALAAAVTTALAEVLEIFERDGFQALRQEYEAACLTLHKAVTVLSPDGSPLFEGVAVGVDDEGNLLVTDREGTTRTVGAGEVSVRGVYGYV